MTDTIVKPEPKTLICTKHGEYKTWVSPEPLFDNYMTNDNCPKCGEDARVEQEAKEKSEKQKQIDDRIMRNGVSKRNLCRTFENLQGVNEAQDRAISQLKQYDSEFNHMHHHDPESKALPSRGMIIVGPVGTGKTLLASALVRSITEKFGNVRLAKTVDIVRDVKSTWDRKSIDGVDQPTESDVISFYAGLDLLIIDEIGVQFGSDTEKMIIFDIIDKRYNSLLPTMVISNFNIDGVKEMLGERTIDRLREDGGKLIVLDGASNRR